MATWIDKEGLTFDDVLLVPQYTEIPSRTHVNLKTNLTKKIKIDIPIVSANMDTITEFEMMAAMNKLGGVGILHRFLLTENANSIIGKCEKHDISPICISMGSNVSSYVIVEPLINEYNIDCVCIDVAHGDCKKVLECIYYMKQSFPDISIIAGNVCTSQATRRLCEHGVDAVKVGVGPGSMCTTRLITGCGFPQLSAIKDCARVADDYNVPIIADGGIIKSGDIVKALAAGASSVMIGGLFAGTNETPGKEVYVDKENRPILEPFVIRIERVNKNVRPSENMNVWNVKKCKKYRGSASHDAMVGWKKGSHVTPEGEAKFIECKGPVGNIVKNLLGGIRSGMTYCNAKTIKQLQENAVFVKVTPNTLVENKPHGLGS